MGDTLTQAFILVTGIAGQILVAHKNTLGFWSWIACNIAMIAVSISQGMHGMTALYGFYTAMCFYSIWKWNKDNPAVQN